MIQVSVDCEKRLITVHWELHLLGRLDADSYKKQIQEAVDTYWNPTPPFHYYGCTVKFVVNFSGGLNQMQKGGLRPFDEWRMSVGTSATGGGATAWDERHYPK
jgi:hypothetical protein